jgi:4-amino-4-deoxy-L-arabinose transferase-like glycosyltransferase
VTIADPDSGIKPLQAREVVLLGALILFGIALRLINITQPYVDAWCWRQADVAMIAENFYRHGFNIFYPQINWAGNAPGYVGTEFPFVPFLASLLYILFGVHEWIGRAVSVLFFAASVPFLYFFVKKVVNARAALFAAAVYVLAPLTIFAGRSFMSDMASLTFSIAALYLFAEWLEHESSLALFTAACLTTAMAILIKLPAVIIGIPFLYMASAQYGWPSLLRRRRLWAFAGLSLIWPIAWYSYAYLLSKSYFPYHFFGEGGLKIGEWKEYLGIMRQAMITGATPVVSAVMLIGIFLPVSGRFRLVFHYWLFVIIVFIIVAARGNHLPWYQLPMMPVAAAFVGIACDYGLRHATKFAVAKLSILLAYCLGFSLIAYLSYRLVAPLYDPWAKPYLEAGEEVNRSAPPDALLIVADDNPTLMYYAKRKGWHLVLEGYPTARQTPWNFLSKGYFDGYPINNEEAITAVELLRKQGASFVAFTRYSFWILERYVTFRRYLDSHYSRIRDTQDYIIFDLSAVTLNSPEVDNSLNSVVLSWDNA